MSLQSEKTLYFRGQDGIGTKGSAVGWGIDSVPLTNASPTQQLVNWLTSCSNWAGAAGVYEQFRPVTLRIRAVPSSALVTNGMPYITALDPTGDFPVAPTPAQVAGYRTSKILTSQEPWEITYALPQPAKNVWYDTAVPTELVGALLVQPLVVQTGGAGFLAYSSLMFEFEVKMRGIGP